MMTARNKLLLCWLLACLSTSYLVFAGPLHREHRHGKEVRVATKLAQTVRKQTLDIIPYEEQVSLKLEVDSRQGSPDSILENVLPDCIPDFRDVLQAMSSIVSSCSSCLLLPPEKCPPSCCISRFVQAKQTLLCSQGAGCMRLFGDNYIRLWSKESIEPTSTSGSSCENLEPIASATQCAARFAIDDGSNVRFAPCANGEPGTNFIVPDTSTVLNGPATCTAPEAEGGSTAAPITETTTMLVNTNDQDDTTSSPTATVSSISTDTIDTTTMLSSTSAMQTTETDSQSTETEAVTVSTTDQVDTSTIPSPTSAMQTTDTESQSTETEAVSVSRTGRIETTPVQTSTSALETTATVALITEAEKMPATTTKKVYTTTVQSVSETTVTVFPITEEVTPDVETTMPATTSASYSTAVPPSTEAGTKLPTISTGKGDMTALVGDSSFSAGSIAFDPDFACAIDPAETLGSADGITYSSADLSMAVISFSLEITNPNCDASPTTLSQGDVDFFRPSACAKLSGAIDCFITNITSGSAVLSGQATFLSGQATFLNDDAAIQAAYTLDAAGFLASIIKAVGDDSEEEEMMESSPEIEMVMETESLSPEMEMESPSPETEMENPSPEVPFFSAGSISFDPDFACSIAPTETLGSVEELPDSLADLLNAIISFSLNITNPNCDVSPTTVSQDDVDFFRRSACGLLSSTIDCFATNITSGSVVLEGQATLMNMAEATAAVDALSAAGFYATVLRAATMEEMASPAPDVDYENTIPSPEHEYEYYYSDDCNVGGNGSHGNGGIHYGDHYGDQNGGYSNHGRDMHHDENQYPPLPGGQHEDSQYYVNDYESTDKYPTSSPEVSLHQEAEASAEDELEGSGEPWYNEDAIENA